MNRTNRTNRIASVMAMHARDRVSWLAVPASVLGAGFVLVLLIAVSITLLFGNATPVYTGAVAAFYFVVMIEAIRAVGGTFPFAVSFGTRRRDYLLGALAWGGALCAAWAILLGLLSFVEGNVVQNWGVGLHFFHLPFLSDGSSLRQFCWSYYHNAACAQSDPNYVHGVVSLGQFWVYFILALFMYTLGLMFGSVYRRFGYVGVYIAFGVVLLLLSAFLLASSYWSWWGAIFGWLAQQSAAGLVVWLIPPMALFALVSYALLRKATV